MRIIALLLLIPFVLISQEKQHKITWTSNFIAESNTLNKGLINSMFNGKLITDSIKSIWINNPGESNIINLEISNRLSYSYHFKNQSIGFIFKDVNLFNAKFTDDLIRLLLEGNFYYQDEILDLSDMNIRADRYQQYKIKYGANIKNVNINGGLSYLVGNHHVSYTIEQASLYTAPLGTYLDIEYNMKGFATDTSNLSPFANNGNGIAIDLGTNFNVKGYNILVSVKDLGFINWSTSSISLVTDSIFNFQGVEVEDIYNFNDSILDTYNIKDDHLKTKNTAFKSYIPATLNISVSRRTKSKYFNKYTAGVISKWQPYMDNKVLSFNKINQGLKESNFHPLYYIHSILNTKYYDLIPSLSYGGYSNKRNIGLALSKGKRNKFIIGTYHIEDIFRRDKASALSLYFNIKLKF